MSYTDKIATIDFYDIQTEAIHYELDIYDRDAYAGEVIELDLSDEPVLLRYGGNGDLFAGKRGSELTINILCELEDDFDWIKTSDSTKYKVEFKRNTVAIWYGYILPGSVVEDFAPFRTLSIIASDRLGLLKDVPYLDEASGYPPEGWESILVSLIRILNSTGIAINIRASVNLYDTAMAATVPDDPLVQAFTRQERFMDADLNASSVDTALNSLLETMDIRAFQSCGYWYLVRSIEYASATLVCRDFNISSGSLIQSLSLSVQKTVTDPGNATIFHLMAGTQTENQLGLKRCTIIENTALRPSVFTGYNFPAKEFVSGSPRHYTISALSEWKMVNNNDACLMYCPDVTAVDQYFESDGYAVSSTSALPMRLIIKGGRLLTSLSLQSWSIHLILVGNAATYYWHNTGWSTSDTAWQPLCQMAEFDSIKDHEFTIDAFPVDGTLSIRFYEVESQFVSEILLTPAPDDDYSFASGRETIAVIDDNNIALPEEKSMILTSSFGTGIWLLSFYDGLIRTLDFDGDPATVWRARGSAGSYYDLKDWKIQSQIDQCKTPTIKLRATIVGEYDYYQSIVVPSLSNKVFAPDDVEIDFRNSLITGTFIEVKTPATEVSYSTDTDTLSAPGAIGKGISRGGYIVDVLPIQTGGQKIVVSGSSVLKTGTVSTGSGTSGFTDYRAKKAVALTSGANTITFSDALPTDSTYVIYAKAYTSEGYEMGYAITNETVTGFDIAVDEVGTLDYQIMREL